MNYFCNVKFHIFNIKTSTKLEKHLKMENIAKAAAVMAGKIVLPVALGIVLNWGFGIFCLVNLLSTSNQRPEYLLLALPLLGLLFPFSYFWLARSYSIKHGLRFIYKNTEGFTHGLIDSAVGYTLNLQHSTGITSATLEGVKGAVRGANEKLPSGIRRIVNFLLKQLPLGEWLEEARQRFEFIPENRAAITEMMTRRTDDYVKNRLLQIGSSGYWFVLLLNVGVIYAVWYFIL